MNKITIDNDIFNYDINNKNIEVKEHDSESLFNVKKIDIKIKNESDLFIDLNNSSFIKLNINIDVNDNTNIYIKSSGNEIKVKYNYNINRNSTCNVFKYNSLNKVHEMVEVHLLEENAAFNYTFKSISNNQENYDYLIYHDFKNTISNIKNNGVNQKGGMNIQISGYIPKDIIGCICNQNNRIINLSNDKCEIRPNLYIDCDDVDANHSALIGKFSEEEMFYLNSRGINDVDANNLLIKGFLLSSIENKEIEEAIIKDIDNYWR